MITDKRTLSVVQLRIAELEFAIYELINDLGVMPERRDGLRKRYYDQLISNREAVDEFLGFKPTDGSVGTLIRKLSERVYNLEERLSDTMSAVTSLASEVAALTAAEAAAEVREKTLQTALQSQITALQAQIATLTTNDTDPTILANIQTVIDNLNKLAVPPATEPALLPLAYANTPPIAVDAKGNTLYAFTGTGTIDTTQWTLSGQYVDPAGVNSAGVALYTFAGDTAPGQANGINVATGWSTVAQPTATV